MTIAGLSPVSLGVAVPVGVCVGVLRFSVCLVSSGRRLVRPYAAVAGWATGLGGSAAGSGVRRVVLCGAQGSWCAVDAARVGAPTLVGRRGAVCVRGWALGDAVSLRLLEGFPQVPEGIRVVLGRGEVAGVDSQGFVRMRQHGFSCGLRHPPSCWLEAAVLQRPLSGLVDQALEGGLCLDPPSHLPELRVGPALPPLSLGGAPVLGGAVGMGGCDWVMATGGGGRPGGFLVVLCCPGAQGVAARADADLRVCAHGLGLGVGYGLALAAVAEHVLYVG